MFCSNSSEKSKLKVFARKSEFNKKGFFRNGLNT